LWLCGLIAFCSASLRTRDIENAFPSSNRRLLQKEGLIGLPGLALDLELGSIRGAFESDAVYKRGYFSNRRDLELGHWQDFGLKDRLVKENQI